MLIGKRGCRFSIGEQKYEEVWIRATGVGGGLFTFGFVVEPGFRILFLASWYPHRGQPTLGNFVERHAHAVALGHRVEVLYFVGEPGRVEPAFETAENGALVEHRVYHAQRPSMRKRWRLLKAGVEAFFSGDLSGFDLVHVHVVHPAGWQAQVLKQRYGLPFVVTEHWTGFHNGRFEQLPRLHRKLAKRTARMASVVCPVSAHLGKAMQAQGLAGRYQVVPNVVDTALFVPRQSGSTEVKQLLHVSHLGDDHKNISGMLRAFKAAVDAGHKLHLSLVGDGDTRPHQATAEALGLTGEHVSFAGEQPLATIAARMGRSHGFVLFSNYENLPCVMIEAWSAGVPVVSTDVGGIAEHLTPERGWLLPKGDEAALTKAFAALAGASPDPKALREYAQTHFSPEAVCRAFTEVYQTALA